jgi:hypothetical protein
MVREIVACTHLPWSSDKWWKLVNAVHDLWILRYLRKYQILKDETALWS